MGRKGFRIQSEEDDSLGEQSEFVKILQIQTYTEERKVKGIRTMLVLGSMRRRDSM